MPLQVIPQARQSNRSRNLFNAMRTASEMWRESKDKKTKAKLASRQQSMQEIELGLVLAREQTQAYGRMYQPELKSMSEKAALIASERPPKDATPEQTVAFEAGKQAAMTALLKRRDAIYKDIQSPMDAFTSSDRVMLFGLGIDKTSKDASKKLEAHKRKLFNKTYKNIVEDTFEGFPSGGREEKPEKEETPQEVFKAITGAVKSLESKAEGQVLADELRVEGRDKLAKYVEDVISNPAFEGRHTGKVRRWMSEINERYFGFTSEQFAAAARERTKKVASGITDENVGKAISAVDRAVGVVEETITGLRKGQKKVGGVAGPRAGYNEGKRAAAIVANSETLDEALENANWHESRGQKQLAKIIRQIVAVKKQNKELEPDYLKTTGRFWQQFNWGRGEK